MKNFNSDIANFNERVSIYAPASTFVKSGFEFRYGSGPNHVPVVAPAPNLPSQQELKAIFEVAQEAFKNDKGFPNNFGWNLSIVHDNKIGASYALNGLIRFTIHRKMTQEQFMDNANEFVTYLDNFIKDKGIIEKAKTIINYLSKDDFAQDYKPEFDSGFWWGGHLRYEVEEDRCFLGNFVQAFSGYINWCKDLNKTPTKSGMHNHVYKSPIIKGHLYDKIIRFDLDRFECFDVQSLDSVKVKDELLFISGTGSSYEHYIKTIKKCLISVPDHMTSIAELLKVDAKIIEVMKQYREESVGKILDKEQAKKRFVHAKSLEALGWPMLNSYYIDKGRGK